MGSAERSSITDRLGDLVDEYSMPEVVEALVALCREYKERLRHEGNGEYRGWEPWEAALAAALREVEGPDEFGE